MTLDETIEALQRLRQTVDGGTEVHFAYNYGDHWRTTVTPKVELIEEATVTHSGYHGMDKLVITEELDEDADTSKHRQVILVS